MHRAQSHRSAAKHLKRKKARKSRFGAVSALIQTRVRRMWKFWMWRKRRGKCRFSMFKVRKRAFGKTWSPVNTQVEPSALESNPGRDAEGSQDAVGAQNGILEPCRSVGLMSEKLNGSDAIGMSVSPGAVSQTSPSQERETVVRTGSETIATSKVSPTVKPRCSPDGIACALATHSEKPRTIAPAQRLENSNPSGQVDCVAPGQEDRTTNGDVIKKTRVGFKELLKDIHEFLDGFYRKYGSFIPLLKSDVLKHVKRKFNADFSDWKELIFSEITNYGTAATLKPVPAFQVVYKKHTLTLDDLSTLADQNWLNDQVMNMYGDLIMDSAHHKVHFLNSFFHRQLMTKGYDGVKRWTKQVDLFSKTFLLVPVHLEVHWCLVTADILKKRICLYDSQGDPLFKVARNILKYLMTEAKEKKLTAFENGWAVSHDEKIPQQTNENDCGVFVLEYCRCLALDKPLQFTQKDIPKIRKRIYKELCDCELLE